MLEHMEMRLARMQASEPRVPFQNPVHVLPRPVKQFAAIRLCQCEQRRFIEKDIAVEPQRVQK